MWEKVRAEIDGYILAYSSAEGSSEEIHVGADATSYQLTSLKPGVLYTIFLWAHKGSRMSKKISSEAETGNLFISYFSSLVFYVSMKHLIIILPSHSLSERE